MRLGELFRLFLRVGMIFGGGVTIMAELSRELVDRRGMVTRADFLTLYGLARIVPSGSMTALAVAYGYVFGRWPGAFVALTGVALPALVPVMVLVVLYERVQGSPWLGVLPNTLMPAAVALLAGAVLSLGREVARPSLELAIAVAAFASVLALRLDPSLLLVAGGVIGALRLRDGK